MRSNQSALDLSTDTAAILIRVHGSLAGIPSPRPEIFAELVVELRRFRPDGRGGLRRVTDLEHLFDLNHHGDLTVPSGLVPRLAAVVRQAGYRVEIEDLAEPASAAPTPDSLGGLDDPRHGFVTSMTAARRGVIQVGFGSDKLAVIELLPKMFERQPIVIITKSRGESKKISRRLRATLKEPVACCTRGRSGSETRVRVGTEPSLDLSLAAVVVFADARQILHRRVRDQLLIFRRQRIYGLLDDQHGLSYRERLVLEAYLGPVLGRLSAPDEHPVDVQAVFADRPRSDRPDQPLGLDWKRRSIWHNADRNNTIARISTALASGDQAALWEFGVFLNDKPDLERPDNQRVSVLVESPEHASVLGRLLPGMASAAS